MKFRQNKKRIDPRHHLNEQGLDELCIPPDCKEISPVPVPTTKRDDDDEELDEIVDPTYARDDGTTMPEKTWQDRHARMRQLASDAPGLDAFVWPGALDAQEAVRTRGMADPARAAHRAAGGPVTVHSPVGEEYFQPHAPTVIRARPKTGDEFVGPDPRWGVTDAEWAAQQSLPDEHVRETLIKQIVNEVIQRMLATDDQ